MRTVGTKEDREEERGQKVMISEDSEIKGQMNINDFI